VASILIICTGNICRSPMGEALLRRDMASQSADSTVSSAGTTDLGGRESPRHAVRTMDKLGIDISGHRSRLATAEILEGSDLILCMAREHVRWVVESDVELYPRTFTLAEFVRRAEPADRSAVVEFATWVEAAHGPRVPQELRGSFVAEDIRDPFGRSARHYRRAADEIGELTAELTRIMPS
jgi:protein-tyrosine-phosphatase